MLPRSPSAGPPATRLGSALPLASVIASDTANPARPRIASRRRDIQPPNLDALAGAAPDRGVGELHERAPRALVLDRVRHPALAPRDTRGRARGAAAHRVEAAGNAASQRDL